MLLEEKILLQEQLGLKFDFKGVNEDLSNSEEILTQMEQDKFLSGQIYDIRIWIGFKILVLLYQELGCMFDEDCEKDTKGNAWLFAYGFLQMLILCYCCFSYKMSTKSSSMVMILIIISCMLKDIAKMCNFDGLLDSFNFAQRAYFVVSMHYQVNMSLFLLFIIHDYNKWSIIGLLILIPFYGMTLGYGFLGEFNSNFM